MKTGPVGTHNAYVAAYHSRALGRREEAVVACRVATCLERWQAFEQDNPDIFSGMYQFWLRKVS